MGHHLGGRELFGDVELTLGERSRVALIGTNGSGKSTLLRVLAGELDADRGSVRAVPRSATVGLIAQRHATLPVAETPAADVHGYLRVRTGLQRALDALELAEHELGGASGVDVDEAVQHHAGALEHWMALGGPDADQRADTVLHTVLPGIDGSRPMHQLSGGQWARVELAAVLLARFDVLLLDEPGNDLDHEGVGMLREHLAQRRGATVLATHDRHLVDGWATEVLELDRGQWHLVAGGLDEHLDRRRAAQAAERDQLAAEAARRDQLAAEAARRRSWAARARRASRSGDEQDKHVRAAAKAGAQHQAGLAQRAGAQVREQRVVRAGRGPWRLQLELPEPVGGPDVVLSLDGVCHPRLGATVSTTVRQGERLAVLGPNGCGKSTLLSLVVGALDSSGGTVLAPPARHVVHLDQHRDVLRGDSGRASVLEVVGARLPSLPQSEVRSLLAKFGVGPRLVGGPVEELSDGLVTRVVLAVASALPCRLLVLDEPTNHLDMEAREQLAGALARWTGTLLVATHDLTLVEALGAEVLSLARGPSPH